MSAAAALLERLGADPARLGLWRSILVYHGQPWRRRALERFFRTLVKPGDLAFDVGAHVGNRSLALARAGARVVALEPQPLFSAYLAEKVAGPAITLDLAHGCIDRLEALGHYRFNHVVGESVRFRLDEWLPAEKFRAALELEAQGERRSGDVYARLAEPAL